LIRHLRLPALLFLTQMLSAGGPVLYLKSSNTKNPIRLRFSFPGDTQNLGQVQYKNGKGAIPVKRLRSRTIEEGPDGRPSLVQTDWQEVLPEGPGGMYSITSQGAVVSEFTYTRKDGKTFEFTDDDEWPEPVKP